jgi:hypothetical protein
VHKYFGKLGAMKFSRPGKCVHARGSILVVVTINVRIFSAKASAR